MRVQGLVWAAKPMWRLTPLFPRHPVQQPESHVLLRETNQGSSKQSPEGRAAFKLWRCHALTWACHPSPDLAFLSYVIGQLCGVLREGSGEMWVQRSWDPLLFP